MRGPMASGVVEQLLTTTDWGELQRTLNQPPITNPAGKGGKPGSGGTGGGKSSDGKKGAKKGAEKGAGKGSATKRKERRQAKFNPGPGPQSVKPIGGADAAGFGF